MTLKEAILSKNLTNNQAAQIIGVSRDILQNYLNGRTPLPEGIIDSIMAVRERKTIRVTRGELVELLKRLNISADDAAAVLWKHHNRMARWADPELSLTQRVPLTTEDLKRIEQAGI